MLESNFQLILTDPRLPCPLSPVGFRTNCCISAVHCFLGRILVSFTTKKKSFPSGCEISIQHLTGRWPSAPHPPNIPFRRALLPDEQRWAQLPGRMESDVSYVSAEQLGEVSSACPSPLPISLLPSLPLPHKAPCCSAPRLAEVGWPLLRSRLMLILDMFMPSLGHFPLLPSRPAVTLVAGGTETSGTWEQGWGWLWCPGSFTQHALKLSGPGISSPLGPRAGQ